MRAGEEAIPTTEYAKQKTKWDEEVYKKLLN